MPALDTSNPAVVNFLKENYEKTARLRMQWNERFKEKLKKAAVHREEKGYTEKDIRKNVMVDCMATITRDHIESGRNRRCKVHRDGILIPRAADLKKGHSIPDVGLGDPKEDPRLDRPDTDFTFDPVMRPIDPEDLEILYKEIPFYGREVYLKTRKKLAADEKYYFPESGGWEYGWRIKDSYFCNKPATHGRVWRLSRDVKSRTGPHPDPDYYKDPDIPGPSKCLK